MDALWSRYQPAEQFLNRFKPKINKGYLMLGDADWAWLEEGKKYKVVIQLDDLTPWDAEATGFRFKPVRPGDFIFLDTNFKNPIF